MLYAGGYVEFGDRVHLLLARGPPGPQAIDGALSDIPPSVRSLAHFVFLGQVGALFLMGTGSLLIGLAYTVSTQTYFYRAFQMHARTHARTHTHSCVCLPPRVSSCMHSCNATCRTSSRTALLYTRRSPSAPPCSSSWPSK
jgi:hypothetical protein